MPALTYQEAQQRLAPLGQEHVLRFWRELPPESQSALLAQIESLDEQLTEQLIDEWIRNEKKPERFENIEPVDVLPYVEEPDSGPAREAYDAGEEALAAGRVGMLLVAGGQGTRLGYDGPKGAFPIGPVTGRSIFAYQADKIRHAERRYGQRFPWYIMVGESNAEATRRFFEKEHHFGIDPADIYFFQQRTMPCVSADGRWMLEAKDRIATNPNGHGGTIPAVIENGIAKDARNRGIDTLSYFQVDNWAIRLADPIFIGYHVARNAEVSSKVCAKSEPREAVGVHCICDGKYQVIEYTELDLYPQLLETDADGKLIHFAGNTAIHVFDLGFIEQVAASFSKFPWHCSFKKVPHLDEHGTLVEPKEPNAYKFETFVFDSLRYVKRGHVVLEIPRIGQYTPIKQFEGPNSVVQARADMNEYWGSWIEAAGGTVKRDSNGAVVPNIEINPRYANSRSEFVAKMSDTRLEVESDLAMDADGKITRPKAAAQ